MRQFKQTGTRLIIVGIMIAFICAPMLIAQIAQAAPTYVSPNYQVEEVFMGAGGLNDASSLNYRARASLGDLTIGNTGITNYQAYGGFTTTTDPYIEIVVPTTNIDLGYITPEATSTTSAKFTIRTYLASGYDIYTISDPPRVTGVPGTHMMDTNSSPTASTVGVEQFGINLVANTSPSNFGANPLQLPDASYSYGQVDNDYNNPNFFMYTKNDRVAYSNSTSGITEFTVSYIYNISEITPAGTYVFNHKLVAVSTF